MDAIRVLKFLAKASVTALGLLLIAVMVSTVYHETRLYTDPKFEGFWDEVEAYHLKRESRRTIKELSRRYGAVTVNAYIEGGGGGLAVCFLPNEDALFACSMGSTLKEKEKYGRIQSLLGRGFAVIFLFGPIFLAARQIQRFLTKIVCLSRTGREARKDYFAANDKHRFLTVLITFGVAVGLSMANVWTKLTPELKQAGITFLDLTVVQLRATNKMRIPGIYNI